MYYKRFYVGSNVVEVYFKKDPETKKCIAVRLIFFKKHRTILKEACIVEGVFLPADVVPATPDEFERALKKSINYFLRETSAYNYMLVDKRNFEKYLKVDSLVLDDTFITERWI